MPACGPARRSSRRWRALALGSFYGGCDVVLSPSPASDAAPRAAWHRRAADPPLGPRRRHRAASTRSCATPGLLGVDVNVLYAGRLTKEKGVELLADAFLAARATRPAPAPGARRRRSRGGAAARPAGRRRDVPRLALRRGPGARLRERRRVPVRQPHRHVRPGRARGAGQRAAGRRRRRGRPRDADRARRDGAARDRRQADALADATLSIVVRAPYSRAPARAALAAVRGRTWEASLERLAAGYRLALEQRAAGRARSVA